jgi:uncharacterized protein YicC (UPF0701 family)
MSEKIDQFTSDLNQRLTGIEAHLKQLKEKLTTTSKEAESTIKAKLAEAKTKLDAKKDGGKGNPGPTAGGQKVRDGD